jgi:hypothetical protein
MRFAMRALVFLALPAVAFSWLLQVQFPDLRVRFEFGVIAADPRDYLLDALIGALPYVAVLAILAAIMLIFGARRTLP